MMFASYRAAERESWGTLESADMSFFGAQGPIGRRATAAFVARDESAMRIGYGWRTGNAGHVVMGGLGVVGSFFEWVSSPATGSLESVGLAAGHMPERARYDADSIFGVASLAAGGEGLLVRGGGAVRIAAPGGTWGGLEATPAAQTYAGLLPRAGASAPVPKGALSLRDIGSLASSLEAESRSCA